MTENTDTSSDQGDTGIDAAANAFDTILTGGPAADTQGTKNAKPEPHDAEEDEENSEAQHADDESETTQEEDEAEEASEDSEDSDEANDAEEDHAPLDPKSTKATVKVLLDGKEEVVPLETLAKGFMMQRDYSKKTAALAEERRGFETERHSVVQEREEYGHLLTALKGHLAEMLPKEPNWENLYANDPAEFMRQKMVWDDRNAKFNAATIEQQRLAHQAKQDQQAHLESVTQREWSKLLEAKPEWKDEAKWTKARNEIKDWALDAGFTPDDLTHAGRDARIIQTMHKAARYDAMMAKKPRPDAVVQNAPSPLKPASKGVAVRSKTEVQKAQLRLQKSGSTVDAAAVFSKLF